MDSDAQKWLAKKAAGFLSRIGIEADQVVLDFGCGEGNYAKASARVVGPRGKVYALDKDRKALNKLRREAREKKLGNIECLHISEDDGIPVPACSVDIVLLYDVLHGGYFPEPEQRDRVLRNIHRVLKPGGLLSLYPTHMKPYAMTFDQIVGEVMDVGFRLEGRSHRRLVHDGNLGRGPVLAFRKEGRQQCGGSQNENNADKA